MLRRGIPEAQAAGRVLWRAKASLMYQRGGSCVLQWQFVLAFLLHQPKISKEVLSLYQKMENQIPCLEHRLRRAWEGGLEVARATLIGEEITTSLAGKWPGSKLLEECGMSVISQENWFGTEGRKRQWGSWLFHIEKKDNKTVIKGILWTYWRKHSTPTPHHWLPFPLWLREADT